MKTRSFQEIYDFCQLDLTYQSYFQIPNDLYCSPTQRNYYYGAVRNGQSRAGTFIYCQSQRQLERFLRGTKDCFRIHIDPKTYETVDFQTFLEHTVYIVARIEEKGVRIRFNHPFVTCWQMDDIYFTPHSHRLFNANGLIDEVRTYIEKHLLFPPGRYRDLQLEYQISKDLFPGWYKQYKKEQHIQAEYEHWQMVDTYQHKDNIGFEDAYNLLAASGMFFDFNCDEFEREELTEQFVQVCNS